MSRVVPTLTGTCLGLAWGAVVADVALRRVRRAAHRRPDGTGGSSPDGGSPAGRVAWSRPDARNESGGADVADAAAGGVVVTMPGAVAVPGGARPGGGPAPAAHRVSVAPGLLPPTARRDDVGPIAGPAAGRPSPTGRGRGQRTIPAAAVDLRSRRSPVAALGAAVRRLQARVGTTTSASATIGPPAPSGTGTPPPADDAPGHADRRAGWATLAGVAVAAVAPTVAALALAWAVCAPVVAARRRAALVERRLHDQLPDVVDLLGLTAAAGLPVGAALVALGGRPGGPVGAALAEAAAHVRHGGSTAGALGRLAAAGPPVRPLVEALAQHDRYGTPLVPALDRVAIEARARRRRRSEEAARRLPVTLLLPLVLTTFPAFVLLTVVPLLAGSLGSLSLSPT